MKIFLLLITLLALTSFASDWEVPAKFKTMKSTVTSDNDGIGEDLWRQHCRSCHGANGFGDGSKASTLKSEMRDISSPEVQSQKDGELYYKSFIGRDEMPNFEKKITSEDDRWAVIAYIRSLK